MSIYTHSKLLCLSFVDSIRNCKKRISLNDLNINLRNFIKIKAVAYKLLINGQSTITKQEENDTGLVIEDWYEYQIAPDIRRFVPRYKQKQVVKEVLE